jgi:hypothetical protein
VSLQWPREAALAFYRDEENGRVLGKASEVGSDKAESKPKQSHTNTLINAIRKLKETRRAAGRLSDSLVSQMIDIATLHVSEVLAGHIRLEERRRKSAQAKNN